jgi:hypothetical protein
MDLKFLNENKITLAFVPIITYVLYLIYCFIRDFASGLSALFISLLGMPITVIGQLALYWILKLSTNPDSKVPGYVLGFVAASSILVTIWRMIVFTKVKVTTSTPKFTPQLRTTSKALLLII